MLLQGWTLEVIATSMDCLARDVDLSLWTHMGEIHAKADGPGDRA